MVGVALQSDECTHLIARPVRYNHRLQTVGGYNLLLGWLFIIKQIRRRPAQPQFSQIVDDIYLFKSALELGLNIGKRLAKLTVHIHAARKKFFLIHFIKAFCKD